MWLVATLIGLGRSGRFFLNHSRPAIDKAMNKYSARTPRFIRTNVSWNNRQIMVAKLMNITETIGVKNRMLMNASIVGI